MCLHKPHGPSYRCDGGLLATTLFPLYCKVFMWWLSEVNAVALLTALSQPACFSVFVTLCLLFIILICLGWIKVIKNIHSQK